MEDRFATEFVKQPLEQAFQQELNVPEFVVSYFKFKVVAHVHSQIDDFVLHFESTTEEKWKKYVQKEIIAFKDRKTAS